ncbi:hypothetical protein ACFVTT_25530 [Streptomyces niveus]|uniref:hypothetical protein n=1 Tax=Streptomyces niveus TaxID=193462 RepID=UPI00343A0569
MRELQIGKRLASVYIPNSVIAPDWRDLPGAAGLGASDYQGAETFLSAIDETYTSWMRDVRLAKMRIIVPAGYPSNHGPGKGASWEDREVFSEMNIPPTAENAGITPNQFAIRFAEHKATIEELLSKFIRNAGYSGGTFGDDSAGPAVTATEIKARTARSMSTRASKAELEALGIAEITETLLILEASGMVPGITRVEVERPDVQFADSVQDDIKTLAETAACLALVVPPRIARARPVPPSVPMSNTPSPVWPSGRAGGASVRPGSSQKPGPRRCRVSSGTGTRRGLPDRARPRTSR